MNQFREIRYNPHKDTWDAIDFQKVFAMNNKSKIDIEVDGKIYKKCKLDFYYFGAGFFQIDALLELKIYSDGSKGYKKICIHDEMGYRYQPFSSYDMEEHKVKIYYQNHTYERKEVSNDKCEKCGRGKIEFGFFIDGKQVKFSNYIEDSIGIV